MSVYEIFSILSGAILVGAAFLTQHEKPTSRLLLFLVGAALAAYGFYVSQQTTGTWTFPAQIFIIPPLALFQFFRTRGSSAPNPRTQSVDAAPDPSTGLLSSSLPPKAPPPFARPRPTSIDPATGLLMPAPMAPPASVEVPRLAFCGECGAGADQQDKFCGTCGARAVAPAAQPTVVPTTPSSSAQESADWIVGALTLAARQRGAPLDIDERAWLRYEPTSGLERPPTPRASRLIPIARAAIRADLGPSVDVVDTDWGPLPAPWDEHTRCVVDSAQFPNLTKLMLRAVRPAPAAR